MSFWVLVQILVNLVLAAVLAVVWIRLNRPAKDDPRLSKGLQLLQSKIAVLEDLSDRTELQVTQLTSLLETKCREIQEKIVAADKQISKIENSAQKSLEVAQIFQDRIPHGEIIERQNTIKYVQAARMAHQGHSVDEIAQRVDLSRGEIEFIAKVNREQLQFSEEDLPDWARGESFEMASSTGGAKKTAVASAASTMQFNLPRENFAGMQAGQTANSMATATAAPAATATKASHQEFFEIDLSRPDGAMTNKAPTTTTANPNSEPATMTAKTSNGKTVQVRPVAFPRLNKDLG